LISEFVQFFNECNDLESDTKERAKSKKYQNMIEPMRKLIKKIGIQKPQDLGFNIEDEIKKQTKSTKEPVGFDIDTPIESSSGFTGQGVKRKGVYYMNTQTGKFGDLHINPNKLLFKNILEFKKKNGKVITHDLTKKEANDLYALLTKRFNTKKRYEDKSIKLFKILMEKSKIPLSQGSNRTNNKKKLLLEIDTTKSKDPNAYLSDQDLIRRLETLIASQGAGNDNILNELSAVLDVLLSRNIINLQQYKDVINAVQNK
jgi:uncharacterized protein YggL (DUF469 family)